MTSEDLEFKIPDIPELNLTEREVQVRDSFAEEYIVDYDSFGAAVRVGFKEKDATSIARRFLNDTYVARKIQELEEVTTEEDKVGKRKLRIIQSLNREAHFKGHGASHSARVAALGKLTEIYGLNAPQKSEVTHNGGVMVVPPLTSADEWSGNASKSQEELKRSVKD